MQLTFPQTLAGSEDEEEEEALVNQVLDELNIEMPDAPTSIATGAATSTASSAPAAAIGVGGGSNKPPPPAGGGGGDAPPPAAGGGGGSSLSDLEARLANLRK